MAAITTAKYKHASSVLLERLKEGRYPVGGRMPTEDELARQFEVSRVTIRRALDILVQDGFLERKQGSGYKVLTLSPASDTCLTSFTDATLRVGLEPASQFLSLELFAPDSAVVVTLPAGLHNIAVTRVTRLRTVNKVPQMLVHTYVPSSLMRDACAADFPETGPNQSILRILSARFKLKWSSACEEISPVTATDNTARLLQVETNDPLLLQSWSAFDEQGDVVFHENVFRTGSISFNLTTQNRQLNYQASNLTN